MAWSFARFTSIFTLFLFVGICSAEEPDLFADEEWKPQTGHPGFFAGGGLFVTTNAPDLSNINRELANAGIPDLKNPVVCFGGNAFGTYKNIRVGGFGFGGSKSTNSTVRDTNASGVTIYLNREAKISVSGGGIVTGYKITLPKSFEVEPSFWLGIATMSLTLQQSNGDPDWNEIWNGMQNYASSSTNDFHQTTLYNTYFYVQPGVFVRYYFKSWAAIALGGQYTISLAKSDNWEFGGKKVSNAKSASVLAPNFTCQLAFGL